MTFCPVEASALSGFGRAWKMHQTIVRCSGDLSGAVLRRVRSCRPLEMDGRGLKSSHVDGQEAPDRVPPDKRFCPVHCPVHAQKTVGEGNGSILAWGYK